MLRLPTLPSRRIVLAFLCLLTFLSVVASAQNVKITVKCAPPAETKSSKAKDEKPQNTAALKLPKFDLNIRQTEKSKGDGLTTESQAGVIPKGCVGVAVITVGPSSSHANQTVLFTISQTNEILRLRWNEQSSYTTSLSTLIQLDNSGSGSSPYFLVLGQDLGTTTLVAESPGFDDALLDINVVECNCPIIPVSSPPRN